MGVTVTNVKIVQCTIFRSNPWTTNWIRRVWNRGATNFETRCSRGGSSSSSSRATTGLPATPKHVLATIDYTHRQSVPVIVVVMMKKYTRKQKLQNKLVTKLKDLNYRVCP